ncbi:MULTISPECIES: hypothetical protein [unclassified Rickettsia]|uniref:hypothetical protein n=1 Tax=unclassified Rickettsia TaxID=114295 RepID=UPI0031330B76
MIKSRHDTAFFQRSYSSGSSRPCCMARSHLVIARRDVVPTRQSREKIAKNAMKIIIFLDCRAPCNRSQ